MADTLKSLIDQSVQVELDNTISKLERTRDLISQLTAAGGFKFDLSTYTNQRKAIDSVVVSNGNLVKSQAEVAKAAQATMKAQILQEKAMQEALKTEKLKQASAAVSQKAAAAESKAIQDLSNDYKQLSIAYNEAALRAKNLVLAAPGSAAAKQALKDANELGDLLKKVDAEVGQHQRNVGNYSSALTGYATTLRGLRGPTKLLGEAIFGSAQAADQLRLVLEHSLQGLAAYFRHKENKAAAEAEDAVVTKANAEAQEEQQVATMASAEASGLATEAMVGQTVATEAATTATEGLAAAFMSTGIGLIIAGLIALIGIAVYNIYEWVKADEHLMEAEKNLAEIEKDVAAGRKRDVEDMKKYNDLNKMKLQQELEAAEKSGQSQEKIFAIKKKINDLDVVNAKLIAKNQGITEDSVNASIKKYENLTVQVDDLTQKLKENTQVEILNQQLRKNSLPGSTPLQLDLPNGDTDKLKKQKDLLAQQLDAAKTERDLQIEVMSDLTKAQNTNDNLKAEQAKFSADEIRRINLESASLEVDLVKTKNELILSDEKSTLDERIKALKSNAEAERKLTEAQKNDVLNNPASTAAERTLAVKKAAEEETKITLESRKTINGIIKQYTQRDLEAFNKVMSSMIETQINVNKEILENEESTLDQRLIARKNQLDLELSLEDQRYSLAKSKLGLTDKEKQALEAEHGVKMSELSQKAANDLQKIQDDAFKKQLATAKAAYQSLIKAQNDSNSQTQSDQTATQAEAMRKLNEQYLNGEISIKKYIDAKQDLEHGNSIEAIDTEIAGIEKLQKVEGISYIEKKKYDDQIAVLRKKRSDEDAKYSDLLTERQKKNIDSALQYEKEASDLVQSIGDAAFERKKNQIQHEIELIDQRKEAEIAAVNTSTLNQQQKAAQMMILEQTAAAQKEKLQREQKQQDIKKAQFDKDIQLFNMGIKLIVDTADLDWVKAAADVAGIASIAAKPVPKYAEGTSYHPGGLALVGEEYKPELIEANGKSLIVDTPTYMNLPRGAVVTPEDKLTEMMIRRSLMAFGLPENKSQQPNTMELQMLHSLGKIEKAIKSQRQPTTNIHIDGSWQAYINQNVRN